LSGIVTALAVFIIFFVFWIYFSSHIIVKIRSSKLNTLDRLLGLFFGVMRAFLLIILFNILVSWIIPVEKQSEFLKDSKYFQLASNFAKPLEELIPQETLNLIKSKSGDFIKEEQNSPKSTKETRSHQNEDVLELFVKLAQPQLKSDTKTETDNASGYEKSEREGLDRLIDSVE
jgi:membrane protein required for colicin V production